ncbi:hypothetical protein LCGC14_2802050 [marine sediment metagenome]|uniref:NTP pyrophosphohydrolase MazG putative catalytic core domain-containing protein n=1 Tax=marine sediment metagenome TaxID=412755 RepID=A0A0F8YMI0_9ZZZZ
MADETKSELSLVLAAAAARSLAAARRKGFVRPASPENDGETVALMHSELSEVLEAIRTDGYRRRSDHVPEISAVAEEYADLIIRVLGACAAHGIDIGTAIEAKMAFNEGRPYRHGKKF